MPTITVYESDLLELIGHKLNHTELAQQLELVKGEIKDISAESGEIKIELCDTNRPDLWCVEGIARQLRCRRTGQLPAYDMFTTKPQPEHCIIAENSVEQVRPAVGGFVVRKAAISEELLVQLIQTQEKLCENYGQRRRAIAIGIYPMHSMEWPVVYRAVEPTDVKFVPLGGEKPLNLKQILAEHPKGQEYAHLLDDCELYPLLTDSSGTVLSFPPVINSRELGEVAVGDSDLFVEATGFDPKLLAVALNILACSFADRGAEVLPLRTEYQFTPAWERKQVFPCQLENSVVLEQQEVTRLVGEDVTVEELCRDLEAYGCTAAAKGESVQVSSPSYRADYLHPVDALEDFLISRGYESFKPEAPTCFTVGKLAPITNFSNRVRKIVTGFGFEEIISNVLMSKEELSERMLSAEPLVEIENVMIETFGVVRNSLLPGLLKLEAASQKAMYPHKIFEVGEVAHFNPKANLGSDTIVQCALLLAHPEANFSELQSYVENLAYYLGTASSVTPTSQPQFIDGRAGQVYIDGEQVGVIGEVHPELLTRWNIRMPCTVCELNLVRLLQMEADR